MNLAEFGDWGLAEKSVANPGVNTYKGQCVSLIQQYLYRVFGVPYKPRGNAKDWERNPLPDVLEKFSATTKLQVGDILVYGSNYGGGYGHMSLVDINFKFLDQNGVKKLEVGYQNQPFPDYVCVLRPKNQLALGLNKNPEETNLPNLSSYNGTSIVDALNSVGYNSSYASRKELAGKLGIEGYTGTAEQNTQMLNLLRGTTGSYYQAANYSGTSIVEALNTIGVDSSYSNRKKIAILNGIGNYTGTANQNTKMLNLLKQGKLKK